MVLSIAANLFLAGLVVGSWIVRPWHGGPGPRPPLQMMVLEASGKLSPDGLKKLSALADELEEHFHRDMAETDALRAPIRAEMEKDTFDAAAFTKAMDALNASFSHRRITANRRFAEVIATLSPADRKQLATIRFP